MTAFGIRRSEGDGSTCFRHPSRVSYVLCQRCAKTICADCQTQAPVGVICPDCLRGQRAAVRSSGPSAATRAARLWRSDRPVVTYAIMGVTAFVFLLQLLPGDPVGRALQFSAVYLAAPVPEAWRLATASLVHGGVLHLAFNLLTLWLFGRVLEPAYGRWRFLALWIVSAIVGSLAVAVLSPATVTVGASGAVFGLFGAYFPIMRRLRMNPTALIVLVALNLAIGFLQPGVAWQAHVGGLVAGLASGALLVRDLEARAGRRWIGVTSVVAIGVLAAIAAVLVSKALVVVTSGWL